MKIKIDNLFVDCKIQVLKEQLVILKQNKKSTSIYLMDFVMYCNN